MRAALAILAVALAGCQPEPVTGAQFYVFKDGVTGSSMDPVKFPVPTVSIMKPFAELRAGDYAVRLERAGFGYHFVTHALVAQDGAGGWITKGINNAKADTEHLTPANYFGWIPQPDNR